MRSKPRPRRGRKLLKAALGVATVSFVGVGCDRFAVANLPAPPSCDAAPLSPYCLAMKRDAAIDTGAMPPPGPDGSNDSRDATGDRDATSAETVSPTDALDAPGDSSDVAGDGSDTTGSASDSGSAGQ
jgi:hypothetical protein